jgi:hypothetical protein
MAADRSARSTVQIVRRLIAVTAASLLVVSGCGKQAGVHARVGELQKAFPAADTNAYISLALSAVRSNDYAAGVIALQSAQRRGAGTAEQLMAIQGTLQALTADLVARAERGDAKARLELAIIEKSRSQ